MSNHAAAPPDPDTLVFASNTLARSDTGNAPVARNPRPTRIAPSIPSCSFARPSAAALTE